MYFSLDDTSKRSKVGATLIGGAFLVFLATSGFIAKLNSTSEATSTNLVALGGPVTLSSLPGPSKWKELAIAAMDINNRCEVGGPKPTPRFTAAMANMRSRDIVVPMAAAKRLVAANAKKGKRAKKAPKKAPAVSGDGKSYATDPRVGAFLPLGYWDPAGFATDVTGGQLAYIREAELKHGRICMLATVGFFVGEKWHPLFGGDIDLPALQIANPANKVDLGVFWPAVLVALGGIELLTSTGRTNPVNSGDRSDIARNTPELKPGLEPGDIGWDPLGLGANTRKKNPAQYYEFQEKEIAHCRLAMIATLGMISQELLFPDQPLGYANPWEVTR